jgi:hypothetical protein
MVYQCVNEILGFIVLAYILSLFYWVARRLPG